MKSPKKVYTAFRQSMLKNSDDWIDLISENILLSGPLAEVIGKEAFIEVNRPFFNSILSSDLHELVKKGDKIITRISTTVNVPSGNTVTLEVCEWYEIEDGKIDSLRVFFDASELKKELGIE